MPRAGLRSWSLSKVKDMQFGKGGEGVTWFFTMGLSGPQLQGETPPLTSFHFSEKVGVLQTRRLRLCGPRVNRGYFKRPPKDHNNHATVQRFIQILNTIRLRRAGPAP